MVRTLMIVRLRGICRTIPGPCRTSSRCAVFFFFQAEDGIRDVAVTGVQTCALPILRFASREKAVLAQVEVGAAVVPGGGATEWLCALAGRSRALEIICGANDFDADTAEKYGWVNRPIPDAHLDHFVDDFGPPRSRFVETELQLPQKLGNPRA